MVLEEGQLPLASGDEPSGHVVVNVVCCLVGDGDTGGGLVAFEGTDAVEGGCTVSIFPGGLLEDVKFEGGGGVEGCCTVPMFDAPDPSRGVKGLCSCLVAVYHHKQYILWSLFLLSL